MEAPSPMKGSSFAMSKMKPMPSLNFQEEDLSSDESDPEDSKHMINLVINMQNKNEQNLSAKKRKLTDALVNTKQQEFGDEAKTAMKKFNSKSARQVKHLLEKKETVDATLQNLIARNAQLHSKITLVHQSHLNAVAKLLGEWDALDRHVIGQKKDSDALKKDVEDIKSQIAGKVHQLESVLRKIKAKEDKQHDPMSKIFGILAGNFNE